MTPQEMVGKRVVFKGGEEHADCWHSKAGLRGGVVKRVARTLSQKAEMIREEGGEVPEGWMDDYEDVPKVWVRADPAEGLPNGCEAAVEVDCLTVEGER
jgi:hypothetical protein